MVSAVSAVSSIVVVTCFVVGTAISAEGPGTFSGAVRVLDFLGGDAADRMASSSSAPADGRARLPNGVGRAAGEGVGTGTVV